MSADVIRSMNRQTLTVNLKQVTASMDMVTVDMPAKS